MSGFFVLPMVVGLDHDTVIFSMVFYMDVFFEEVFIFNILINRLIYILFNKKNLFFNKIPPKVLIKGDLCDCGKLFSQKQAFRDYTAFDKRLYFLYLFPIELIKRL